MSRVLAPAKLTLTLAVTGVRADGLHELRSEMVALSLADELHIDQGGSGLTVTADPGTRGDELGDGTDNLVVRALAAVGRKAAVHIVKRIPLGGGLGGGSSDAAAVLRWAGCTDCGVAAALGADVPFSLVGGRALVEGVGERVTPLAYQRRAFLLLIPPFGVDTGRAYAAWDELGAPAHGDNVLTPAALAVEPRLAGWRDALGELTGSDPRLAGSGSTWFVEVEAAGEEAAETAETSDRSEAPWLVRGDERARLVRVETVPAGWDET